MKTEELDFLKSLYNKIVDIHVQFDRSMILKFKSIIDSYDELNKNRKLILIRKADHDWWYSVNDKYYVNHATEEDLIPSGIKDSHLYYWRVSEGKHEGNIIRKEDTIIL